MTGGFGKVGLGQHHHVGDRGLTHRFNVALELKHPLTASTVVTTPGGAKMVAQNRIGLERREHREGIGEPGAFDHQPPERRYQPPLAPRMEIADRARQFAANGAAHAARFEQHHLIVQPLDQKVIDSDFAEFVDDDGGVPERGIGQQAAQQRGLAEPRKPVSSVTGVKAGKIEMAEAPSPMTGIQSIEKFRCERIAGPAA